MNRNQYLATGAVLFTSAFIGDQLMFLALKPNTNIPDYTADEDEKPQQQQQPQEQKNKAEEHMKQVEQIKSNTTTPSTAVTEAEQSVLSITYWTGLLGLSSRVPDRKD
eukprot:Clim_evm47s148 gene=Clim_evmTU47s148